MSRPKGYIYFLANAGFLLRYGHRHILVDGLHQGKTRFSPMDDEQTNRIVRGIGRFRYIDCFLVTHAHADHYSHSLMREFFNNHPETSLVAPSDPMHALPGPLNAPAGSVMMPGLTITFMQLPHAGEEYKNVLNYGYCVQMEEQYEFLVFGDAEVSVDTIATLHPGHKVNAAFVNFPFVTLKEGRRALKSELDAEQLYAIHLPFPEDDHNSYRQSTSWAASQAVALGLPPVTILDRKNMVLPIA